MQRLLSLIAISLVLFASDGRAQRDRPPPNLVLIVADDLGWSDLACYGNAFHETPNLDRLAATGMRFTDAYAASPVCSPTRASILTGKHPARLHMTIWRESAKERGNRELLQPVCLDSLPLEEITLAEILRDAGYYTAHVGKWHVGDAKAYPQAHGFRVNVGGTLWGAPQTFFYPYNGDAYFKDWRYVPDLEPGERGDYLTDALTDRAIEIVEGQVAWRRPFFLNLWYHTVHTPIEGKPELVDYYENKMLGDPEAKNPHYAAMVDSLDENVGRLLEALEENGVADNTVVIFTSDNGGFVNTCKLNKDLPVTSNAPLRSGKGSCYEGGIRVPLIVHGPGIEKGKESAEPVVSCDLFPTLLELVGLSESVEHEIDGIDFGPLLTKEGGKLKRDTLFFHYPHYYPTTKPVSAIRDGKWKLLQYLGEGGAVELYDLEADLEESQNLAATNAKKRDDLLGKLEAWRKEVEAQMPEKNPDFKPKKK